MYSTIYNVHPIFHKIQKYCEKNSIIKLYSPPQSHENNGLIKITKTLLQWSKLDLEFWDYAAKHANFIYNFTPHSGINLSIPYEIFHDEKINFKILKSIRLQDIL